MRKARPLQCQDGHHDMAKAPWDALRLARVTAPVAGGPFNVAAAVFMVWTPRVGRITRLSAP